MSVPELDQLANSPLTVVADTDNIADHNQQEIDALDTLADTLVDGLLADHEEAQGCQGHYQQLQCSDHNLFAHSLSRNI